MPAFNTALPTLPRSFDLRDVVDQADRKIEVADQAVALAQQQLQAIGFNMSSATVGATGAGVAWADADEYSMPRPAYIVSDAGVESYVAAIAAAIAALATARAQLQAIPALV